jgi:hypothetical protein
MKCPNCETQITVANSGPGTAPRNVTAYEIRRDGRPLDCGHCGTQVYAGRRSNREW